MPYIFNCPTDGHVVRICSYARFVWHIGNPSKFSVPFPFSCFLFYSIVSSSFLLLLTVTAL